MYSLLVSQKCSTTCKFSSFNTALVMYDNVPSDLSLEQEVNINMLLCCMAAYHSLILIQEVKHMCTWRTCTARQCCKTAMQCLNILIGGVSHHRMSSRLTDVATACHRLNSAALHRAALLHITCLLHCKFIGLTHPEDKFFEYKQLA